MRDFSPFRALSFDCYGTLIDWETGIRHALQPWAAEHALDTSSDELLARFGAHEHVIQAESPALAYPLVRSSRLYLTDGAVMVQRSRAFLAILLGLAALRIGLRDYVGHLLPPRETASIFFLLAFGMIVRWRLWMYLRYRAIMNSQPD